LGVHDKSEGSAQGAAMGSVKPRRGEEERRRRGERIRSLFLLVSLSPLLLFSLSSLLLFLG